MITAKISRKDAEEHPYLIWNLFLKVLSSHGYTGLAPEQRPAHLVFLYEGEVQNGGHLQYFENQRCAYLEETISALRLLGAHSYEQILREASTLFLSRPRKRILTVKEYVQTAWEEEFTEYDKRLYNGSPPLDEYLKRHLQEHQANFVTIV